MAEINIRNLGYIYSTELTSTGDIVFLGSKITNDSWRTGNIHYSILSNQLVANISTGIKSSTDTIVNSAIDDIRSTLGNTYTLTSVASNISTELKNDITAINKQITSIQAGTVDSDTIKKAVIKDIQIENYAKISSVSVISTSLTTDITSISTNYIKKTDVSNISTTLNSEIISISKSLDDLSDKVAALSTMGTGSSSGETIGDIDPKLSFNINRLTSDLYGQFVDLSNDKYLSSSDNIVYTLYDNTSDRYRPSMMSVLNDIRNSVGSNGLNFYYLYPMLTFEFSIDVTCSEGLKLYTKTNQLKSSQYSDQDDNVTDFNKYKYIPTSIIGISCNDPDIEIYNVYIKSENEYCFLINANSAKTAKIDLLVITCQVGK